MPRVSNSFYVKTLKCKYNIKIYIINKEYYLRYFVEREKHREEYEPPVVPSFAFSLA